MENLKNSAEEGQNFLNLLGLGNLGGNPIPGYSGKKMNQFLDICGENARPLIEGFKSLSPDDPKYQTTKELLSEYILKFVQPEETT